MNLLVAIATIVHISIPFKSLGVISWRSEFSTDEDLSGVTTKAPMDWTQEPQTNTQRQEENWADFTSVTFGKDEM